MPAELVHGLADDGAERRAVAAASAAGQRRTRIAGQPETPIMRRSLQKNGVNAS